MTKITINISSIVNEIELAATHYARPPQSVTLMAVTKTQPVSAILEARSAGITHFGENYVQEALSKIQVIADPSITWHFIGSIQDNKTKFLAENFSWVHSITRIKTAERLSRQRPLELGPLNLCIEVNVANEQSKTGITIEELAALAEAVQRLPNVRLRGLMTMAPFGCSTSEQRNMFKQLHEAFAQLCQTGIALDTLSMGMTDDFDSAIAEGSTFVRIGAGIFGARK